MMVKNPSQLKIVPAHYHKRKLLYVAMRYTIHKNDSFTCANSKCSLQWKHWAVV